MTAGRLTQPAGGPVPCARCGAPLDAIPFDEASVVPWTADSRELVLARFRLPDQYCGRLDFLMQFTDHQAAAPAAVQTPSIRWQLLINRTPLMPYGDLRIILNPWGQWQPGVDLRLPAGCTVEFVARRVPGEPDGGVSVVGGRLGGRYWYDSTYGTLRRT